MDSVAKKKVIIVGGHEQACNVFDYIIESDVAEIVLCVCRQDDAGIDEVFPSLLNKARKYDVPSLQPLKLNSNRVIGTVASLGADIVLSLQNNMIFGKEWIDSFQDKLGIVNVHYAPLPKYAGFWPEMWAIWNGETEFAVSIHYVGSGIDTGPLIAQRSFNISESDTRKTLYDKSSRECLAMLLEQIPLILQEKVPSIEQDQSKRTYFPKSLPNNGFLDLSWDEETQNRFIRAIAFPGFPGPKIKIGQSVYTIVAEDLQFFKKLGINQ